MLLAAAGITGFLARLPFASSGDYESRSGPIPGVTFERGAVTKGSSPVLIVTSVESGSAAKSAGITSGDIIELVDGTPVGSGPEVRNVIAGGRDAHVSLRLRRNGAWRDAALPLPYGRDT